MSIRAVDRIIAQFGGLAPLARALGHNNAGTVQGWQRRGVVPSRQIPLVIQAGRGLGFQLEPNDFFDEYNGEQANG